MEKLSKEEAIANHRKMWNWIADECLKRGMKVTKKDYFSEMGIKEMPLNLCYCCEYAKSITEIAIETGFDCSKCPLIWSLIDEKSRCYGNDSPYRHFDASFCEEYYIRKAREIANLPVKEGQNEV